MPAWIARDHDYEMAWKKSKIPFIQGIYWLFFKGVIMQAIDKRELERVAGGGLTIGGVQVKPGMDFNGIISQNSGGVGIGIGGSAGKNGKGGNGIGINIRNRSFN